jgi:hypothetical protein
MNDIHLIVAEYNRLRADKLEVKDALDSLRDQIETLDEPGKQELARQLRAIEAGHGVPASIRRLNLDTSTASMIPRDIVWVNCPHCGRSNQQHELLCYACGHLLEKLSSEFATQALAETSDLSYSDDYFGPGSVLVLRVRGTSTLFEVRPADSTEEIIIGRKVAGSAIVPDVDLTGVEGETHGVSRLHLSIRFQPRHNALSIFDLGSANGTYVNGQRLHPHEVRVLRHGDELRLGRLVLGVVFRHA